MGIHNESLSEHELLAVLPLLNWELWKEESIGSIGRRPGFRDACLSPWEDMSFDITRLQSSPLYLSVMNHVQNRIPPIPIVSPKP